MIHSSNRLDSFTSTSSKSSFVIAVGVTIAMLYFGRQILIPLALAFVLSFLLTPLVGSIQRVHLGRIPAVLIVLLFCFAVTATVGWGVASQLLEITTHIPDYKTNLEDKIQSLHSKKNTPLIQATATVQQLNKELASAPAAAAAAAEKNRSGRPVPVQVTAPPSNFVQDLRTLLGPLAGPMETAGLVILFMAFMLINREDLRNRLIRLGGQGRLNVMTQALEDASDRLSRYLLLQLLVNSGYGCVFGAGLYVIGVPHALLWGAIAALLRFVPYVGAWIATAFPMAMALAVFPGWRQVLVTFALFAMLEGIVANIIEPWIYGAHTGISSFAILVAAVFWASLWGPVGLILSTPLTLCLLLVGRYVPQMTFLEILLGDGPALNPEQLFYQRLLAMDQDEAGSIADEFLQDHNVMDLYDSVLVPALRLSEEDRHIEVLDDRSADFISQSTRELIEDIGGRAPTSDTAERDTFRSGFAATTVLCVPARDEADELVGMMLTQLLQQAGCSRASHLAINTVERMLDQVGEAKPRLVCISALPPFAVGQARSLCRRLHARFPEVRIVVGLWGFAGGIVKAEERIGPACTDSVCTTLSEAIHQIRTLIELGQSADTGRISHHGLDDGRNKPAQLASD